jgi:hypothetical protein
MLLEDQPVVVARIVGVINDLFVSDKHAKANMRWLDAGHKYTQRVYR